jgi:signal peptidase II
MQSGVEGDGMSFKRYLPQFSLLSLAVVILIFDRWTKVLAEARLSGGRVFTIIDGLFDFSLVYNTGAAFGIGRNWPESYRKFFFLGVSCLAVVMMFWLLLRMFREGWLPRLALTMVLAGALGNLYDRFSYGHVVDFIHAFYRQHHWPNFNIADSSISVGITLFAIHLLKADNKPKQI